jgi:hypothetical protein
MKVYRTDKGGIGIWKLAGVVDRDDARVLLRTLRETDDSARGCFIIDFENVQHVDYRVFGLLEEGCPEGACVLLSGLSDYLLDIFAFVTRKHVLAVYPDWKKALRHFIVERGKLAHSLAAGAAGGK